MSVLPLAQLKANDVKIVYIKDSILFPSTNENLTKQIVPSSLFKVAREHQTIINPSNDFDALNALLRRIEFHFPQIVIDQSGIICYL